MDISLVQLPVAQVPDMDGTLYKEADAADMLDDPRSVMPQSICGGEEAAKVVKANTFLASGGKTGRINDIRMLRVTKFDEKHYIGDRLSVSERERMLGLPEGYVSEPGKYSTFILGRKDIRTC